MFKWLRLKLIPILQFCGRIHFPWVEKNITGEDYSIIHEKIRPGDILLTRTMGFFSNVLIPGYWKHVGVVSEDRNIIEAIGRGVVKTDLAVFTLTKDAILVIRPKFCDKEAAKEAAKTASLYIGANYDYAFSLTNKAFYCAELAYVAYKETLGDLFEFEFELRERLGVLTVTADDYAKATKQWAPIHDSRARHD